MVVPSLGLLLLFFFSNVNELWKILLFFGYLFFHAFSKKENERKNIKIVNMNRVLVVDFPFWMGENRVEGQLFVCFICIIIIIMPNRTFMFMKYALVFHCAYHLFVFGAGVFLC